MGIGRWTMVRGQWAVSGQWTLNSGQRAANSWQWTVSRGQWWTAIIKTLPVKAAKRYTKKPRQAFVSSSLDPLSLSAAVTLVSVC